MEEKINESNQALTKPSTLKYQKTQCQLKIKDYATKILLFVVQNLKMALKKANILQNTESLFD